MYTSNQIIQKLDELFTSRIWMNYFILTTKGISLMGSATEYHGLTKDLIYNPVTQTTSHYMTIDCAYIGLLVEFGLLATIVICIAYFCLAKKLFKYNAVNLIFVMSILYVYGLTSVGKNIAQITRSWNGMKPILI